MTDRRPNADLAHACARCGRRYPRMYQEGDSIVCRVGECRPMRRSDLTPERIEALADEAERGYEVTDLRPVRP